MPGLELDKQEVTIVLLALCLLDELLPKSSYHPLLQAAIHERLHQLIERIQNPRPQ